MDVFRLQLFVTFRIDWFGGCPLSGGSELKRRSFFAGLGLMVAGVAMLGGAAPSWATVVAHVAIHVDDDDPDRMNMALGNAENIEKYYDGRGEEVAIEFVTNGPGLAMLREDISPVKDRIAKMSSHMPNLTFSACANSIATIKKRSGVDVPLVPQAKIVDSGVVRLMELQTEGYSYLRP
jgi:intracellular sulfur oxidation DsrE/DsrF family protein